VYTVDHLLGMENCQESLYGCCPDGLTAAEGPNFVGCASNDPIPTGLCIESEFGCCMDGVTPASGPFNEGCQIPTCQVEHPICNCKLLIIISIGSAQQLVLVHSRNVLPFLASL